MSKNLINLTLWHYNVLSGTCVSKLPLRDFNCSCKPQYNKNLAYNPLSSIKSIINLASSSGVNSRCTKSCSSFSSTTDNFVVVTDGVSVCGWSLLKINPICLIYYV